MKKMLNLPSNLLSYNLKILLKENFVKKEKLFFSLTDKSKALMPYIHLSNDASSLPMPCVATIIKKKRENFNTKKNKKTRKRKKHFYWWQNAFWERCFRRM